MSVSLLSYAFSAKHRSSPTIDEVSGQKLLLNQLIKTIAMTIFSSFFLLLGAIPAFFLASGHFKLTNRIKWSSSKTKKAAEQKVDVIALQKLQMPPEKKIIQVKEKKAADDGPLSWHDLMPSYTREPLPQPSTGGIVSGLPNFTTIDGTQEAIKNICWLNSCLKHLAATNGYDRIFGVEVHLLNIPEREKLALIEMQKSLYDLTKALRSGQTITVEASQRAVLDINKSFEDLGGQVGASQLDAVEFLEKLTTTFGLSPTNDRDFPLFRTHYTSNAEGAYSKAGTLLAPAWRIEVPLPQEALRADKYPHIDLDERIADPSEIEMNADNDAGGTLKPFIKRQLLVNAPEQLEIKIARVLYDAEGEEVKCNKPIKLNGTATGTLTLSQYDRDERTDNAAPMPKAVHTYQITSAIIQEGGSGGGHYFAVILHGNGTYYRHDDHTVTPLLPAHATALLSSAYYLRLKRHSD